MKPVRPNRPLYLALTLCIATFAALGLPLLVEPSGQVTEGPHEQLPRHQIPAMLTIPQLREMASVGATGNGHDNGNGHSDDQ